MMINCGNNPTSIATMVMKVLHNMCGHDLLDVWPECGDICKYLTFCMLLEYLSESVTVQDVKS